MHVEGDTGSLSVCQMTDMILHFPYYYYCKIAKVGLNLDEFLKGLSITIQYIIHTLNAQGL